MLEASGFDVVDLGIDVPPSKIIEATRKENIKIIGLSGVLTVAIESMRKTVEALKEAGLRDEVKIIVGGAPITEMANERIGADAWSVNPQKTVTICREWSQS